MRYCNAEKFTIIVENLPEVKASFNQAKNNNK